MRRSLEIEAKVKKQTLAAIALACYSGALAALLALSYSLLAVALSACDQNILAIYWSRGL